MEKRESFAQALCDLFVKYKTITPAQARAMQRAFKTSTKETFDNFLLEEGLIEESVLLRALSDYYEVPCIDVVGYFFETFLLHKFPKDFLLRNEIIPLEVVDEEILMMVANDPSDQELLPQIGEFVSYDIQFNVGLARDICDSVKEFYDKSLTQVDSKTDDSLGIGHEDQDLVHEHEAEQEVYREILKEEDESDALVHPIEQWDDEEEDEEV
jgi:hypothetical protein